jgi:hypothetical protein
MDSSPLIIPLLATGLELLIACSLEARLVVALGRRPSSRLVGACLSGLPFPESRERVATAVLTVLLVLVQALPLIRLGVLGDSHPPDHISGSFVIVAELLFGAWLWLGTRPHPAAKTGG